MVEVNPVEAKSEILQEDQQGDGEDGTEEAFEERLFEVSHCDSHSSEGDFLEFYGGESQNACEEKTQEEDHVGILIT